MTEEETRVSLAKYFVRAAQTALLMPEFAQATRDVTAAIFMEVEKAIMTKRDLIQVQGPGGVS